MPKTKKHTVSNSRVHATHLVLPGDTNLHGTIFGGKVMQWIDIAAAISAKRHCHKGVVTASIDDLHFLHPIRLGNIVNIVAEVTYCGNTSMEVEVRVFAESPSKVKKQQTLVAYTTFVAVDKEGKPVKVPPIVPETEREMQRYAAAKKRREERLKRLKLSQQICTS